MTFGLKSPREYIEDKHAELHRSVENALKGDLTVVSVVSINDDDGGQMILADTSYDKKKLAARLRLCADILDRPPAGNVLTRDLVEREAIGRNGPRLEGHGRLT